VGIPTPQRKDFATIEDRPLRPERLAAIWRELPERERFSFILSLDERLCDQVIALTYDTPAGRRFLAAGRVARGVLYLACLAGVYQ
jgi:hypothetical protein